MGTMDLNTVRSCWGNSIFEYVQSDSVGYSGGILCIWDPNSFRRNSFTRSDYFVIIRGVWLKSGIDLLIVVVYAPQDAKEKHMLWEYLTHISNSWDGKIVMMGDFNEVRFKSDRFGSNFNVHEAEKFNSFIYNAGMEEVSLGGSAFTWCHRSASKMSKLDRFFVSENLLTSCPNISAITLERFISDHRPILLRETSFDYGPIPFRLYKYWLEVDGFDKMVRESWEAAPGNKDNAIRSFMADRQILDGPFILNEVLQWCRKKRKHALIFKVDFEKAYDSVRWDFLDDVLDKFGFGVKWRNWIQSCLRSYRGSNFFSKGVKRREFQFFRGGEGDTSTGRKYSRFYQIKMGNGAIYRFGLDKWYEEQFDSMRRSCKQISLVPVLTGYEKDFFMVECGVYGG
ncbi:RNA-directed DNA polymerase, eukaryota [Tanacetum coccineum]